MLHKVLLLGDWKFSCPFFNSNFGSLVFILLHDIVYNLWNFVWCYQILFPKWKGNQEVKTIFSVDMCLKLKPLLRQSQVLFEQPPNARRSLLKIAWFNLSSDIVQWLVQAFFQGKAVRSTKNRAFNNFRFQSSMLFRCSMEPSLLLGQYRLKIL